MQFAHMDHALELITIVGFRAAESLIREYFDHLPFLFAIEQLGIYSNLVCIGVQLISRIGRDSAIGCDSLLLKSLLCDGRDELRSGHISWLLSLDFWVGRFVIKCRRNLLAGCQRHYTQRNSNSQGKWRNRIKP